MKLRTFLVILFYIKFCSSQLLHQSEIDGRLSEANDGRIYKENRIAKILSEYSKQIQNCSSSLKSSNAPKDVSTSLDNFNILIQQISTIKNFETYKNISTCGDINYKITMMEFEQRKLIWIREKINFNISLAYKQHAELIRAYQVNLNALGYLSKNERMAAKIISDLSTVLRSLLEYFGSLSVDIANLAYFNAILSVFKENYCQCLKTVSWTGKGSTYDVNIQAFEDRLTQTQSRIINFTSTALSKVNQAGTLSTNLQTLQTFLKNILTISDYMKITWKNIQDCNDYFNRMKFLEFKRFQYIQILSSANVNRTYLVIYHQRVNATMNNQKSIGDVLASTLTLQNVYLQYISLLSHSIVKISRMIFDFDFYGDTFCSCEPANVETTSLASTSSLTPSTRRLTTSTTRAITSLAKTTTQTLTTLARTTSTSITTESPTTTSTIEVPTTIISTTLPQTLSSTSTSTLAPMSTMSTIISTGFSTSETVTTTESSLKPATIESQITTSVTETPVNQNQTTSTVITTTLKPTTSTSTTVKTTSTSTTRTTTTRAPICGDTYSLKSFDPSDPLTPGLESGNFLDNSTIYPGHGYFGTECLGPSTAAIVLGSTKYPRGAYSPCQIGMPFKSDTINARYYWASPDLKWVVTNCTSAESVPGALFITVHDGHVGCLGYVARYNFTSNGNTYSTIGYFWNKGKNILYWTGSNTETSTLVKFEVLACQKSTT